MQRRAFSHVWPWMRSLGPAMGRPRLRETLRFATGATLALFLCGLLLGHVRLAAGAPDLGLFLIAPLGASTFLLFAVPNSPLAQPWSAIVGNTVSALVAIAVLRLGLAQPLTAGLAVGGAMAAMAILRAMHPPGAAVALATVLGAAQFAPMGFGFALAPVMLDTVALVLAAILWNRATGRKYPFRQPAVENIHHTADPAPQRRLGLGAEDLAALLARFNMSANIGPEDFGRILAAAEEEAARLRFARLRCADVMSRDLVTVRAGTRLGAVADLFGRHLFKTLPVVDGQGRLLGIITQNDLIQRARAESLRNHGSFGAAMAGLRQAASGRRMRAGDLMRPVVPVAADSPAGALIPLLSDGGLQAVPVVEGDRLIGVVTRSDLISALSRDAALHPPFPAVA